MGRKRQDLTARRLRALYRERVQAACEETLKNGGGMPADCVDHLNRLKQLVELSESSALSRFRQHGVAAVALLSTLAATSVLLFMHTLRTEIGLDVSVSELSFSLDGEQILSPGPHLASIGVSGLRRIELFDLTGARDQTIQSEDGSESILLNVEQGRKGSVTLPAVKLPSATRIHLRAMGPQRYRLSLDTSQAPLSPFAVDFDGSVRVALARERVRTQRGGGTAQVLVYPGSGRIDLDFEAPAGSRMDLGQQWRVNGLALNRVERFMDANQTRVRNVSTLLSGALYMDSLNGERRTLRPGEGIRFEESSGEVRTLGIEANPIALQYQGQVRGMTTGFGDTRTNLMPTLLEWLRVRHGLSLLWGSTIYLFGLLTAVLRWLKVLQ